MDFSKIKLLHSIGKGSYSNVYYGKLDDKDYAIKSFKNEKKYLPSTQNEIMISEMFRTNTEKCDYIIKSFGSYFNRTHHLVFELLDMNLYNFTKFYKEDLDDTLSTNICIQICSGLEYIHKDIIHSDLKPENIMVDTINRIFKIIDFGLSFFILQKKKNFNIQSMYYRCPEVCFQVNITPVIDIWSMGCIVFELFAKEVLFKTTRNTELAFKFYETFDKINPLYKDSSMFETYFHETNHYYKLKYNLDDEYRLHSILTSKLENTNIIPILEKALDCNYETRINATELLNLFKNML